MSPRGVVKRRVCSACSRRFTRTEHLERHERSHTKEKPFGCTHCTKSFSRRDTLTRHNKLHLQPVSAALPDTDQLMSPTSSEDAEVQLDERVTSPQANPPNDVVHVPMLAPPTDATDGVAVPPPINEAFDGFDGFDAAFGNGVDPWPVMEAALTLGNDLHGQEAFDVPNVLEWGWMSNSIPGNRSVVLRGVDTTTQVNLGFPNVRVQPAAITSLETASSAVQRLWNTNLQDHADTPNTLPPCESDSKCTEIGENYRRSMQNRLQIDVLHHSLPSSDFLNLCVRCYFTRFHPIFPIVHIPTFRLSQTTAGSLISICSVGSLFTGVADAKIQGATLFERLNKTVLATSWEERLARGVEETTPMIQAALIGQTFGLLSGDGKHLAAVDAFHGTVISWARRAGVFGQHNDFLSPQCIETGDVDAWWRRWVKREESIRIGLALYIHDAELTNIFYHPPCLRQSGTDITAAATEQMFAAEDPSDWTSCYSCESQAWDFQRSENDDLENNRSVTVTTSGFDAYAKLQSISSTILEIRLAGRLTSSQTPEIVEELIVFHKQNLSTTLQNRRYDLFGLAILWHHCFLSLFVDIDLVQRVIGRDGRIVQPADRAKVEAWAESVEATRCIAHISIMQERLDTLPLGLEPPMHIPRAIFDSAIVWYCSTLYSGMAMPTGPITEPFFPEITMLGPSRGQSLMERSYGLRWGTTNAETQDKLNRYVDMLQGVGHSGVANKYATILHALIQQNTTPRN